jgi:hypothetical protein
VHVPVASIALSVVVAIVQSEGVELAKESVPSLAPEEMVAATVAVSPYLRVSGLVVIVVVRKARFIVNCPAITVTLS